MKMKEDLIKEWRNEYEYNEETDEEIWDEVTTLSHLYGDLDEDDEWYYILNAKLKDEYGVWFVDEKALKTQVNNAKMNSCSVKNIVFLLARTIHRGVKNNIKWLEVIDKTPDSFIGTQAY